MNIHFEKLWVYDALIESMIKWYNDDEIAPFIHPNMHATDQPTYSKNEVLISCAYHPDKFNYLILDGLKAIGEVSITRNFFMLHNNVPNSAWVSICIGEKEYWGKGIATMAMDFLEDECRKMGFSRIELGVFENNIRAITRYRKLGYREIARYPKFTYSKGEWYADIRMEKTLQQRKNGG